MGNLLSTLTQSPSPADKSSSSNTPQTDIETAVLTKETSSNRIELENELKETLNKFGQEHLVRFFDELSDSEREALINDLKKTNFEQISEYYARIRGELFKTDAESSNAGQLTDEQMQPMPPNLKGSWARSSQAELDDYESKGLEAIAENKVAVILLAGGQGTRLGVNYPKGMYSVDLHSKKTLYQIQAERLVKLKQLADEKYGNDSNNNETKSIPLYIMTSEQTRDMNREFFETNNYFGLNKSDVVFFEQFMLPCLTKEGKIILDEKFKLSKSPDGNGGLYKALRERGILHDMNSRGIQYVHVYCVDNILVRMADPVFVGFCIEKHANCAAKVVKKTEPDEKVGVICKVNDKFQVVEYSEITETSRNLRDDNEELVYNAGNICNHFFTYDFLFNVCNHHEHELRHHIAEKKIAYVDENGERIQPKQINGIKLEKFVFDVFPFSNQFVIWEVPRDDEFSPLKNGMDCVKENPQTCRQDLYAQHLKWLLKAGARFKPNEDNRKTEIEISPLVSYNGEGLKEILNGQELGHSLYIELDAKNNNVVFSEIF